ncbi:MAG: pseudouridine synthase [Spongiibacteraceae bacterium]|jgi:23S rRNA pseudouridine2605 synthase|nr:pseudouridine synthase [Spongiibacteraceae bacterium]
MTANEPRKPSGEKLQKVLARAGLGSRREMEQLIADGQVQVNGRVAGLGDRVGSDDAVLVRGRKLRTEALQEQPSRVLIYNKPDGEICSRRDPEGRPSVFDRLPVLKGQRWISVGRLDINTTGLLLFTTDGELANSLMHPSSTIDREYLCRVRGEVDNDMLQRLRDGVLLEDGVARFSDITEGGGEGSNRHFYVSIMEGRNREVRRLWESQGLQVSRLKRVRFGTLFLSSRLKQGQWQELNQEEVAAVYQLAGLAPPRPATRAPAEQRAMARQQRRNRGVTPGTARARRTRN